MTPEASLKIVRELSENAMLRPANKVLALASPEEVRPGPRRAAFAQEDFCPIKIGSEAGRASGQKSRKRRELVPEVEPTTDFMAAAVDKTAA